MTTAEPVENRTGAHWWRLLLAILAVHLGYWLLIEPWLFAKARPPARLPIIAASVATPEGPDWDQVKQAHFVATELPYEDCCHAPGYRAIRAVFRADTIPPTGLGLIANTWADNFSLYLNGKLLSLRGRMRLPDITYNGLDRQIFFLPPGLLEPGENAVTIVMVRDGVGDFAVAPPLVADYVELSERMALRDYILNDYLVVSYTTGVVLGLLALALALRTSDRRLPLWALVLLATWVFRLVMLNADDPPFSGLLRLWLGFLAMGLLAVAWLNFIDAWTDRPLRHLQTISVLALVAYGIAGGYWLLADPVHALDLHDGLMAIFGAAATTLVALRLVWHCLRHPGDRVWEAALFLLCVSLMAADMIELLWRGSGFFNRINTSLPLLMLALAISFLGRNVHLFRSMNEFNQLLSQKLAERETQLRRNWQERQALIRQSALAEERRRIMRDMHDGLGGRLVSLAAQLQGARRADAAPIGHTEIAGELLLALDDMRLIVDSLDTAGDDLALALGAFRGRMEPRLQGSGLSTSWDLAPDLGELHLPAAAILDIYRILQEAFANVLRHARARHVCLRARRVAGGMVWIDVEDDGAGMPGGVSAGKGCQSMSLRAAKHGAKVEWQALQPGTRVRIELPATVQRQVPGAESGGPDA